MRVRQLATYGSNSLCVRFQVNQIAEPLPENKSQEMPAHRPMVAGLTGYPCTLAAIPRA